MTFDEEASCNEQKSNPSECENILVYKQASINPTGGIIGLLYKQNVNTMIYQEAWFTAAVEYIWRYFEQEQPRGYHDGIHWITFLQHTHDREQAGKYWPAIGEWLKHHGTIERNPYAVGYTHKVLDWAPHPGSYASRHISNDDVENHLRALIAQQQEDGGWPINWLPLSTGAEAEWRGWITVKRLKTLASYGML